MYHPRRFMISIYVDPIYQGRGIGSEIYDSLSNRLETLNTEVVWASNKEDYTREGEFYEHRGFREKSHAWESRLDLATFDPSKFQNYITRVTEDGISFTTLEEQKGKGEAFLRPLHELVQLIQADMPREASFTPLAIDQWQALSLNSPRILPAGYIIAKQGSEFVGMSNVLKNDQEPRILSQDDTGVRRDYRGRGIAVALKVKVGEFAKRNGYEMIKTWNDSNNAPMLAVNNKLGFKRRVGWALLQKDIPRKIG